MSVLFWVMFATIAYVYVGYPLLLWIVAVTRRPAVFPTASADPTVTLVISAFNEDAVIEAKLENSRALDYPREKLEVLVVSDASDDETDVIVRRNEDRMIRLLRMQERGGKTLGLNEGVRQARGDIIVFSDANAMYQASAIRQLIECFVDERTGAAVGESRYEDSEEGSDQNESLYWRYELWIKAMETASGSVVGGDGAIYAVRRHLYRDMSADALSDFVNPLQVVKQGYRCVYAREAICVEEAAASYQKEFRRKVRIVNRAWRAMWTMADLLNVFRYGWFSIKIVSHKLLRWLIPVFLISLYVSNAFLLGAGWFYVAFFTTQTLFYVLAIIGYLLRSRSGLPAFLSIPYYFCLVNVASLFGIIEAYLGKTYTTWATPRVKAD